MKYKIAFILEQALGHITHSRNLQSNIPSSVDLTPIWLPVPYDVIGTTAKIPGFNSNWTIRSGIRARKLLKDNLINGPYDGLFFHTQVPAVLCADWVRSYPTIISLDATPIQFDQLGDFYHHKPGPGWLENIKNNLNKSALNSAQCLVAWTEWTKMSLIRDYGVAEEKIAVIPPGVNPELWKKPIGFQKVNDHKVRILFVGGDLQRKGGDLLINAFRKLAASHKAERLELHLVTKTAVQEGDGIFVYSNFGSNDPRLIDLYHQCDIFALPTSGDCLPMVLSEAGAAGLPCISTTVAAIPEVIPDGKSGLLIPPGDEKALYQALETLVNDENLRIRMGNEAVEIISNQFDAVKNTSRLLSLLSETIEISKQRKMRKEN